MIVTLESTLTCPLCFNESYAQDKAVLFAPEGSPRAAGVVAGVIRRPLEARRGWRNPYVVVPLSWAPEQGPLSVHASVGWTRDANAARDLTLWGVAAEAPMGERFTVVAEAFSENREKPWLRVGGRYALVKDALDVDLTVVARSGGTRDERYVSLGFTWQSAPFLP